MSTRVAQRPSVATRRAAWWPLVLLACAALAVAGAASRQPLPSVAAAVLLLLAWLPAAWRRRSLPAAGAWLSLAALLLVPAAMGHAQLALMALPVVFLALAATLFARTLRRGAEPLVARCIRVIDGEAQLARPRVRGYARGVTVFWAWLLGAMACLSLLVALLARPGGWLATLGVESPASVPGWLLAWYPELGCWIVLATAFAGEYAFRRWYLRGTPQPGLGRFLVQLARCWPALARGEDAGA